MSIANDNFEEYEKLIELNTEEEVLSYFENILKFNFKKLHPLKGQKVFNPKI